MKMTLPLVVVGSTLVFAAVVFTTVLVPGLTMTQEPSAVHRPRTAEEDEGRALFIANGCTYCHSQAVRANDWDLGAERVAQAGDYIDDQPHLLGSERHGPDLSQAGGEHPDDWHVAHFVNPRFTRPDSIMPPFAFLGADRAKKLIAYVQSLGYRDADYRMARQIKYKAEAAKAFEAGTDANVKWLHDNVPAPWRALPNPYPSSASAIERGRWVYEHWCIGCHGEVGDGMGPAAKTLYPPPFNFTVLRERLGADKVGGIFYYQIMNGITGTAMPYFKRELESEKIWAVGEFVARFFVGVSDADTEPKGIDAAFEMREGAHAATRPAEPPAQPAATPAAGGTGQ